MIEGTAISKSKWVNQFIKSCLFELELSKLKRSIYIYAFVNVFCFIVEHI